MDLLAGRDVPAALSNSFAVLKLPWSPLLVDHKAVCNASSQHVERSLPGRARVGEPAGLFPRQGVQTRLAADLFPDRFVGSVQRHRCRLLGRTPCEVAWWADRPVADAARLGGGPRDATVAVAQADCDLCRLASGIDL